MTMADYLPDKLADYTTTTLSVVPQKTMLEEADKNQIVHEADDGTLSVVSLSDQTKFTVTLQWDSITNDESDTIMDFFMNNLKGNGRERTFYWEHPTDGNTYTVRFLQPLSKTYTAGFVSYKAVNQTQLRVEGVKP